MCKVSRPTISNVRTTNERLWNESLCVCVCVCTNRKKTRFRNCLNAGYVYIFVIAWSQCQCYSIRSERCFTAKNVKREILKKWRNTREETHHRGIRVTFGIIVDHDGIYARCFYLYARFTWFYFYLWKRHDLFLSLHKKY